MASHARTVLFPVDLGESSAATATLRWAGRELMRPSDKAILFHVSAHRSPLTFGNLVWPLTPPSFRLPHPVAPSVVPSFGYGADVVLTEGAYPAYDKTAHERAEKALSELSSSLGDCASIQRILISAPSADPTSVGRCVTSFAEKEGGVTLIVVCRRGLGRLSEAVFGSTASWLVHNSKVPLVILHEASLEKQD